MADPRNLMVQMVGILLGVGPARPRSALPPVEETGGRAHLPTRGESFRPHNVGISWAQAERLWEVSEASCKGRRCSSYLPSAPAAPPGSMSNGRIGARPPRRPTEERIERRSRLK